MQPGTAQKWDQWAPWERSLAAQREAGFRAACDAAKLPAYRRAWVAAGLDPDGLRAEDWSRLPTISKETLIEGAQLAPPFGERLGVELAELAHVFVAPGPIYMPFTAPDLAHVATSFAKALSACGLVSSDVVDQTTMYNWVIAATVIDQALHRIGCCVVPGGIGQTDRHIEVIRGLGVTAVVAFPTFLEHIVALAAETGQELPLRKAVVMGELSRPDMKARFRAEHGLEVREFYGAADVGAIAWECEAGDGMHLRDDLLVEFLAPRSSIEATPTGTAPTELVVTDFHRRAMPVIRLRTGDLVDHVASGPCGCGRTSPRIRRIVGRASEITKVKGMFVVPRQVQDVFRSLGEERRFRLVVDRRDGGRDELTLELEGAGADPVTGLKEGVERVLRMRVALAIVDSLPEGGPLLVDRRLQRSDA